ncbi:MAG TPA: hypothetical protein VI074_13565 [Propionibacteriaceae bacterium]
MSQPGFLIGIGASGIRWGFALALLAGGLVATPLAAYLVKIALAHLLGVAVGGLIVLTNLRTILSSFEVSGAARIPAYLAVLLVTGSACISLLRAASGELSAPPAIQRWSPSTPDGVLKQRAQRR